MEKCGVVWRERVKCDGERNPIASADQPCGIAVFPRTRVPEIDAFFSLYDGPAKAFFAGIRMPGSFQHQIDRFLLEQRRSALAVNSGDKPNQVVGRCYPSACRFPSVEI